MKRIFTIIAFTVCIYTVSAQPYVTGKRTITYVDAGRTNREVPTDIYYPANTAGNNVAIASGTAKFPVVVFGHGFLIGTSSYKWLADSLVRRGYVVALPSTESGLIPDHLNFGLDLSFLCTRISQQNDSATSFLYQRLVKKSAVAGHSMGGGASFLASATLNSSINAIFNFAAAETTPAATLAAFLNTKPTLIFSGSADCITKDSLQEVMYNNTLLACKTYINLTDALHCQFANNNLICLAGQFASGCGTSPVSTSTVFGKTMSLLAPFLDYYLKDICTSGSTFVFNYNNITGVTEKRRSCFPYPSCGPVPVTLTSFTGNVKNDKVNLYWNTAAEYNVDRMIVERSADGISFNQLSSVMPKGTANGASYSQVDLYPYNGINFYRLKTVDLDGSFTYSNIIKLQTTKKPLAITQLYPNPVQDNLNLQIQVEKRQPVHFQVFDPTGKLVHATVVNMNSGLNEVSIPLGKLSAGIYIIQYKNDEGHSGTHRILKD